MHDLADQDVRQVPGVVCGEVQRVGPAPVGRVDGRVVNAEGDLQFVTDLGRGRHADVGHLQVGRRRGVDQHRLRGRAGVVVVLPELVDLADRSGAPGAGRVGHDEHVVRPGQIARRGEAQGSVVAAAGGQAAAVRHVAEVAVLAGVEEAVLGQEHHVVPGALVGRRLAPEVVDAVVDAEGLAGDHVVDRADLRHLQVRRRCQRDRHRDRGDVVALVLELRHRAGTGHLPQCVEPVADRAGHAVIRVLEGAGIGLDDDEVVAADRRGQGEGGAVGVRLAGLQIAGFALAVAQLRQLDAQLGFDRRATVDQRQVGWIQAGVGGEVDAVEPLALARRTGAVVGHRPADSDGLARLRVRVRQRDRADLQVRLAVGDGEAAFTDVVVVARAFEDAARVEPVAHVGVVLLARDALALRLRQRQVAAVVPGARVGIGNHIDVVLPLCPGRQAELPGRGVARTGRQAILVVVQDVADPDGAARDQGRIGADEHPVEPVLGPRPHRSAAVGYRPAHRGELAGEVLRLGLHRRHLQIGRRRRHCRRSGACVVALVDLAHTAPGVGLHHQLQSGDGRVERHGLGGRVSLALAERAVLVEAAEQPLDAGLREVGVVAHPDAVGPFAGEAVTAVLHRVAEAVAAGGLRSGRRHHLRHREVGRRDAQHRDGPRFVVVVVELVRIVGVDVLRHRVLEDHVVGIAPHRHEILPRGHAVGQAHLQVAEIVLAHAELAGVRDLAELDVALGRRRAGSVHREPDRIGPAVGGGAVAPGGGRAEVADFVVDRNGAAVHRLVGRHDVRRHQVGEGHRVDDEARAGDVVGLVGILVDAVAAVGHHDEVGRAAQADRDVHRGHGGGVAFPRRERGAALDARHQHVVAADLAVERQVDVVGPLARGRHRSQVGHDEAQAGGAAGSRLVGRHDLGDTQVRAVVERHLHHVGRGGGVVAPRVAVLVQTGAGVGRHAQAVAAFDLRRQAQLLGAGVADARSQAAVVGERAERDRRAAVQRHQLHAVDPGTGRAGHALVQHGPGDVDQRPFLCRGGHRDRFDQQVRRGRQLHRHAGRAAGVVAAVDEFERATGGDIEVVGAGEALRQRELQRAGVGVVGGELAEDRGRAQVPACAAAVGIGRQPDLVGPAVGVGDADAAVGHCPAHADGAAAEGAGRRAHRFDPQVGIRDRHDVDLAAGGRVVGFVAALPDGVAGVGAHQDPAAARQARGELHRQAGAVAVADLQCAVVGDAAEHDVVAVTEHVVDRIDDAVGPGGRAAGTVALVLHAPVHRQRGRVGDRQRRCADLRDRQVGIRIGLDVEVQHQPVVGLASSRLVVGRRAVGDDDEAVGARRIDRQHDVEAGIDL